MLLMWSCDSWKCSICISNNLLQRSRDTEHLSCKCPVYWFTPVFINSKDFCFSSWGSDSSWNTSCHTYKTQRDHLQVLFHQPPATICCLEAACIPTTQWAALHYIYTAVTKGNKETRGEVCLCCICVSITIWDHFTPGSLYLPWFISQASTTQCTKPRE